MDRPSLLEASVPLAPLTTFGVGGPAELFARPASLPQLQELLAWALGADRAWRVLGRGSNLLLPDEGLPGLLLRLDGECASVEWTDFGCRVGAGYSLPKLAIEAARGGRSGLERFVGVPATVGGALAMNAGCLGAEIAGVVRRVRVLDAEGNADWLTAEQMRFAYRHSRLQERREICVEAELALGFGEPEALMEVLRVENKRRHQTQPYTLPSAGSVFKNPPGHYAGRLIEQAGLKGARVGGAEVSPVHANFIVNVGGATALDILRLMSRIRRRVLEEHGLLLEPEIQLWGGLAERLAELDHS